MIVFSSLSAALREGYRWSEYLHHEQLHRVERDAQRPDGKRVKMLAFARPQPEDSDAPVDELFFSSPL